MPLVYAKTSVESRLREFGYSLCQQSLIQVPGADLRLRHFPRIRLLVQMGMERSIWGLLEEYPDGFATFTEDLHRHRYLHVLDEVFGPVDRLLGRKPQRRPIYRTPSD